MKKYFVLFLSFLMISVHCFAEFIISPTVGFSNVFTGEIMGDTEKVKSLNVSLFTKEQFSWLPFTFGIDIGKIKEVGISAGIGRLRVKEIEYGKSGDSYWAFSALTQNLKGDDQILLLINTGIPIQLGAQYFFTKKIGINLGLQNSVGFGFIRTPGRKIGLAAEHPDFPPFRIDFSVLNLNNTFILKFGPIFKF